MSSLRDTWRKRHVIEENLPREVGPLRRSDYNTSQFIHRADSSAAEVTRGRRERFPEVPKRERSEVHAHDIVDF